MNILIAPDSFKESLSALKVSQAIASGFKDIFPSVNCILLPVADGGKGTTDALINSTGGKARFTQVQDPLGNPINAQWGILGNGKTAVIETAAASGLDLVPNELRNPLLTSSYGTGQLIMAALEEGGEKIIIGLGGSATNDGGCGILRALGAVFTDQHGQPLPPGGGSLANLADLDISNLDPRLYSVTFEVACDVDNPFLGPEGASAVFGPQKGANPQQVAELEQCLTNYSDILSRVCGVDIRSIPGSGAAGGIGAALSALFKTELKSGIEIVLDAVEINKHLPTSQLVITGEGKIDDQSLRGKTPIGVAKRAKTFGCPVIALAGSVSQEQEAIINSGIDAVFSVVSGVTSLEAALKEAEVNIQNCARNIATLIKINQ